MWSARLYEEQEAKVRFLSVPFMSKQKRYNMKTPIGEFKPLYDEQKVELVISTYFGTETIVLSKGSLIQLQKQIEDVLELLEKSQQNKDKKGFA
jgi:hypothetical protein